MTRHGPWTIQRSEWLPEWEACMDQIRTPEANSGGNLLTGPPSGLTEGWTCLDFATS